MDHKNEADKHIYGNCEYHIITQQHQLHMIAEYQFNEVIQTERRNNACFSNIQ